MMRTVGSDFERNYCPAVEFIDFVADFARRTLANLDCVQNEERNGREDVYPFTQLWNSLLGLIVLPREADLDRIPATPLADLWVQGWPRVTVSVGADRTQTLPDLVIALRNAVAHFNVSFHAGSDREITSVTVWNDELKNGKPIEGKRRWEAKIEVGDIEGLARAIAGLYLRKFAAAA